MIQDEVDLTGTEGAHGGEREKQEAGAEHCMSQAAHSRAYQGPA